MKQAVLPLTFRNPDDYKLIGCVAFASRRTCPKPRYSSGDKVSTIGLHQLLGTQGSSAEIALRVVKPDGTEHVVPVSHDMSPDKVRRTLPD
jgi:hypothetical protein